MSVVVILVIIGIFIILGLLIFVILPLLIQWPYSLINASGTSTDTGTDPDTNTDPDTGSGVTYSWIRTNNCNSTHMCTGAEISSCVSSDGVVVNDSMCLPENQKPTTTIDCGTCIPDPYKNGTNQIINRDFTLQDKGSGFFLGVNDVDEGGMYDKPTIFTSTANSGIVVKATGQCFRIGQQTNACEVYESYLHLHADGSITCPLFKADNNNKKCRFISVLDGTSAQLNISETPDVLDYKWKIQYV